MGAADLARLIRAVGAALEPLVELLDALGGDPDLEDEGEREDDDPQEEDDPAEDGDHGEDGGDDEPSLAGFGTFPGSTDDFEMEFGGLGDKHSQRHWAADHSDEGDGRCDDEDSDPGGCEHDGREPEDGW